MRPKTVISHVFVLNSAPAHNITGGRYKAHTLTWHKLDVNCQCEDSAALPITKKVHYPPVKKLGETQSQYRCDEGKKYHCPCWESNLGHPA
jgi:hypothetical protein